MSYLFSVIDFCLTKVLVTDEETNLASLRLTWASRSSCIQRAGRAGRVAEGRVYRMVHERFYKVCIQFKLNYFLVYFLLY